MARTVGSGEAYNLKETKFLHWKSQRNQVLGLREIPNCSTRYEIGKLIRQRRLDAGISQVHLAKSIRLRETGEPSAEGIVARLEQGLLEPQFYIIEQKK
jgi:ribosome-binding protein aMBF1 (putative translation factor)